MQRLRKQQHRIIKAIKHSLKQPPPIVDVDAAAPARAHDPGLLGMSEAIEQLKTTRSTFYRWLRSGQIRGLKVGHQWRFELKELERFLKGEKPHVELRGDIQPLLDLLASRAAELTAPALDLPEDTDVQRAVKLMLEVALAMGASDLHLAPHVQAQAENNVAALRCRVDGVLHLVAECDARLLPGLVEQWKILAACDTHETRPQDGQVKLLLGPDQERVGLRVSFMPTGLGESLTARILWLRDTPLTLDAIHYAPTDKEKLTKWLANPWGLIVVSGPVGCGKTTVLYSCLQHVASPERKAVTVEDPIEFYFPWAVQTQLDPRQGITYPVAGRAVLRSDPDAVLIGEVRDFETLDMVLRAALNGHLVLTTMHTNDAAGVLRRMVDLGAESFVVGDAVKLIVAQRLVRRLCPHCSKKGAPSKALLEEAQSVATTGGLDWASLPKNFHKPVGCAKCKDLGYLGRDVVAEMLEVTPEIAAALQRGASKEELHALAVKQGMTSIAADGIRRAAAGTTTLDEVRRVLAFK